MTDPQSSIPAGAHIGHVHLKVADLDRAVDFYRRRSRFRARHSLRQPGRLSLGGWVSPPHRAQYLGEPGRSPRRRRGRPGSITSPSTTPSGEILAAALKRLLDYGWGIDGASDHGTHEAIYLHDPDGNGIELAWDRDPALWHRGGEIIFERKALDWAGLMAELDDTAPAEVLAGLARYS